MSFDFIRTPLASTTPLKSEEVHLWRVDLSEADPSALRTGPLSETETTRYNRFHREADARRFAARRVALRCILAAYLDCAPADVGFEAQDAAGKPTLADPRRDALVFNASSSADVALVAVAKTGSLGVDVERARTIEDMEKIAERFFTRTETAHLKAQRPDRVTNAFYRIWTSKEALLKAAGTGLPGGLDRFEVSTDPARAPALLRDAKGGAFHLYPADPAAGYFGALAADTPDLRVVRFAFDPADVP